MTSQIAARTAKPAVQLPVALLTRWGRARLPEALNIAGVVSKPVKVSALFPGPHVVDTGLFNSGRVRPQDLKKDIEGNASGISSVEDMKKMCAEFGIELQTTHPDEVAAMALEGLQKDAFWLLSTTPETDRKIRARADMILDRKTPVPDQVGA
mgnify:CR=1 FL=1